MTAKFLSNRGSLLVAFHLALAFHISACSPNSPTSILEQNAKESVANLMKDTESAKFRNLSVDEKSNVVCGEVNSKNSYGAMAGFEGFIYENGTAHLESDSGYSAFIKLCTLSDDASLKRLHNFTERLTRQLEE